VRHANNALFEGGREPWCVPDEVSRAEVREVCERCPSGALSYTDKTGAAEQAPDENTITLAYNGPLYATGRLDIDAAQPDMKASNIAPPCVAAARPRTSPSATTAIWMPAFRTLAPSATRGRVLPRPAVRSSQSGAEWAADRRGQSDHPCRQRSCCLAGRKGLSLPLRGVEEKALLRRQPQARGL
jgi:hypothetical protein